MPSPLFSLLGGGSPQPFQNIIAKYKQFRAAFSGGNPREQVERLLQSGYITQQQLNQYQQMAQQIQNAMKGDASQWQN